jgi:hypothetical protein
MISQDLFSPREGIEGFTKNLQNNNEILALQEGIFYEIKMSKRCGKQ